VHPALGELIKDVVNFGALFSLSLSRWRPSISGTSSTSLTLQTIHSALVDSRFLLLSEASMEGAVIAPISRNEVVQCTAFAPL